ncbi:MAG: tandem-95 repeat protein, partial [Hyphomicrobiaceae bacterium]
GSTGGTVDVKVVSLLPEANADVVRGIEDTPLEIAPSLLIANDVDPEGHELVLTGVLNARHGSVSFDGVNIVFTPDANYDGKASFDYTVTDAVRGVSVGSVTVEVASTNHAPIAATDIFEGVEDTPFIFRPADLVANDSDPDGDAYTFVGLSTLSTGGRILELTDGRYEFVPNENVNGPVSFNYTITDGRKTTTGAFTFDLAPVNDAPIANRDGIYFGKQDLPLTIRFADLIANDRDVEGDSFALYEVFDGDNGTVVQVGDTAVFTGREGYYGNAGFAYRVTDEHGAMSVGHVALTIMPTFDLPIAVSDAGFEMLEDSYIDLDPAALMANDYIPEGTTAIFLDIEGGGVTKLSNGLYRFTPEANVFGFANLTYAITNESGFAIPTTVTINVLPLEDAPVAIGEQLAMVEDTPLTIFTTKILNNDFDVDRQAIVLERIVGSNGVHVVDNGIGQLVITPDADVSGPAWFDYEIIDSTGRTAQARVDIELTGINDAPVIAAIPTLGGRENTFFSATLPTGFVSDVDSDALAISARGVLSTPLPAWLSYNSVTQTFSGLPPAGFSGVVEVEITAADAVSETVRKIVISIVPYNIDPLVASTNAIAIAEDVSSAPISIGASDPNLDPLTYSIDQTTAPTKGSVVFDAARGTFTYAPSADANGGDTFTIVVADGRGGEARQTVSVAIASVNDAPVAHDDSIVALEDDVIVLSGALLANDTDVDGDALTITRVSAGPNATAVLQADGSVRVERAADFNGEIVLSYTVSDGALTSDATATLDIRPVNDAPVVMVALAAQLSPEDSVWSYTVPASTFADVDGDALSYAASAADGSSLPSWLAFDTTTRTFTGTPPQNFNGRIDLVVSASDGMATVATPLTLTVTVVNDAPVVQLALADQSAPEDAPWTFTIPASTFADVDGDRLSYTAVLQDGAPLPPWLQLDPVSGVFSGTPPANYNGAFGVVVIASDGYDTVSASVQLIITPVNDAPVISGPTSVAIDEDSPLVSTIVATDVDGDALSYSLKTDAAPLQGTVMIAADGTFLYRPHADANGADSFTVQVSDGHGGVGEQVVSVTIVAVNDAPIAVVDSVTTPEDLAVSLNVIANDSDVDGDSIQLLSATAEQGIVSVSGGIVTYTPVSNMSGADTVTYQISDGQGGSATGTLVVIVTPVNDAPTLVIPLAAQTSPEDATWSYQIPVDTFADVDGDALTLTATLQDGAPLPSWLQLDPTSGVFTGTPPSNFNGTLGVVVLASDGSGQASAPLTLTITPLNDAPVVAAPIAPQSSAEDAAWIYTVPAATFADLDGDQLVLSASLASGAALPSWLTFNVGTQTFAGTPPANFNGIIDVVVAASDGAISVATPLTLTVTPVNDAPIVTAPLAVQSSPEDAAWTYTVPAGVFADVDGDALIYSARMASGTSLPVWLSFDAASLTFAGTPPNNFNGPINLLLTASDGSASTTAALQLNITPVNDTPTLLAPFSDRFVVEDQPFNITLQQGLVTDIDGDALSYSLSQADGTPIPAWMVFDGSTLQLTGTPPSNFAGSIALSLHISDGTAVISDGFAFSVTGINDAPVVASPLPDILNGTDGQPLLKVGTAFTIPIPVATFSDPDGDPLQFAAREVGQSSLPTWMTFDGTTITGTAPSSVLNAQGVAEFNIEVLASDGTLQNSETFTVRFAADG